METFEAVARWTALALYVVLAGVSIRIWLRRRTPAAKWVALTFTDLAAFALLSPLVPDEGLVGDLGRRATILGLLLFPYFLYRFAISFHPPGRVLRAFADGGVAVLALVTLVLPDLDAGTAWWFRLYGFAFIIVWVTLFGVVAFRLYRGGRGQPTLARRRMRLLALGAFLMGAAFVLSVAGSSVVTGEDAPSDPEPSVLSVSSQLLAVGSAWVFIVGFAPPAILRTAWRQPEEQDLHRAALRLLAATTRDEVTTTLLPHLAGVVGASGVEIRDERGGRVGSWGVPVAPVEDPATVRLPLRAGEVRVATSSYTPFFGVEEHQLLRRLGVLADLALDRVELVEQLRHANDRLEEANDELESFVYSASHDLKNPLIAVLGYLDVLQTDYADALDEQGRWYVERMVTNSRFMESLISDLLELSRVGRIEVDTSRVPLGPLVEDLAADLGRQDPPVRVVAEELPTVWINRARARQLFANLFENAAKYGNRPELSVSVWSEVTTGGGRRVHVADDGVGVPPEYHERVFGMFERLEADESRTAGTGMGLALCRKIVQSVGGDIALTPSEVGAHFVIDLPPDVIDGSPEEPPPPPDRLLEVRP